MLRFRRSTNASRVNFSGPLLLWETKNLLIFRENALLVPDPVLRNFFEKRIRFRKVGLPISLKESNYFCFLEDQEVSCLNSVTLFLVTIFIKKLKLKSLKSFNSTLWYRINVPGRLLIFRKFSTHDVLILYRTFINFP